MQSNFNVVLLCNNTHINPNTGVFGVLDERFRDMQHPIPARATSCSCRRTRKCFVGCANALSGIQSGHKISIHKKGRVM